MVERHNLVQAPSVESSGVFAIALDGEFDIAERAQLLGAFAEATNWPLIIVDFERTRYVDSTVLECLVALDRAAAKRNSKLILVGLRPEIRRIFEICDLQRHFDIRPQFTEVATTLRLNGSDLHRVTLVAEPIRDVGDIEAHRTEVSREF
ncbi:MAG: STAS domain-containing protein [Candidatus Eremiobacteraeota bacterium]|nr:STAS domain-containing protein [Candidatus Eremiobacteraeota bacterium]MBV9264509.1 STAS domain-containing protein [Candidatus Eremiobacteraeota bacterium]